MTYTTIQGDTWDIVALKIYGSEKHSDYLMSQNYDVLGVLIFPEGIKLNTPELPEEIDGDLPPWRG
ncbi:MAG: tail protein X [Sporomusa sp.]